MTSTSITVPKRVVIVLLASFYTLAFIITPYWRVLESTSTMVIILALTLLVGAIWLIFSGDDLRLRFDSTRWGFPVMLLAISILLNFKPLVSVIPWRGDEDYFISNTLALAFTTSIKWLVILLAALALLIYLAWRNSRWTLPLGIITLSGIILFLWLENPFAGIKDTILFRYPYVNYWFFALLPKLALTLRLEPYYEILFRVIPLFASFALVWICQVYFRRPETPIDLLWGCAVATIPLVYYYSSILYLELPPIVLMTLVCFNIRNLLSDDFPRLKQNPFWYALILIGFIKETTIIFLLGLIFWRLIAFLLKRRAVSSQAESFSYGLIQEIKIAFATLLPAVLYLFLRSFQTRNRSFSPEMMGLTDPQVLYAIGQSLLDQLGPFLILFLAGSFLLLLRNEYLVAGFFASLFLAYPLFFALDAAGYAGYSRFNLYVLPPVLAASGWLIRALMSKKKLVSVILAGGIVLINLWISPINGDGTKKPFWGVYLADTAEHYYPYREALTWLKETHGDDRILFTGMHYPYISFAFYFGKLDWEPDHEIALTENTEDYRALLTAALTTAEADNFDVVLYQITGDEIPPIEDSHGFVEEKIFRNDAHQLIVYFRPSTASK